MDFFLGLLMLAVIGFACHIIARLNRKNRELEEYLNCALRLLHEVGFSSIDLINFKKRAKR